MFGYCFEGEGVQEGGKHYHYGWIEMYDSYSKLVPFQRSEKISVGSTLFMVVVLAAAACFVSLGFGKFQVILITLHLFFGHIART